MKKKLFDIPRLKLGLSKADKRRAEELFADGLDSPPLEPKSVRPPLSPRTDYELRTACALVLEDFKPSHQIYSEQYGDHDAPEVEPRLDREIINEATEEEEQDAEIEEPLNPVNTRAAPVGAETEREVNSVPRLDELKLEPTMISQELFHDEDWEQMQAQRQALVAKIERTTPYERVKAEPPITARLHKRSASNPVQLHSILMKSEPMERPRTAPRSDSTMTTGSTPQTDGTDYGWTASTAPTSAAITPAPLSDRTSSQALHGGSADSSMPKFSSADAEKMRQQLEKYKRVQEEAGTQQGLDDQVAIDLPRDTASEFVFPPSSVVRVPARKPVPTSGPDSRQSATPHRRTNSRPSTELRRSTSRRRRSTPRSESKHELGMLRPESRQAGHDTEDMPEPMPYPTMGMISIERRSPPEPTPSATLSRAPSRSRSITRQVREYIRPSSRASSRNVSMDISRPQSRARSIDSVRSAVSSLAPSIDSATHKWRSWKPFHRNQGSQDNISRASSMRSMGSVRRGRAESSESRQSPSHPKSKPPINLNRELPPLPSLDQWKAEDEEPESDIPSKPIHIASLASSNPRSFDENEYETRPQTQRLLSQKQSVDSASPEQARDSVLNDVPSPSNVYPERVSSRAGPTNPLLTEEPPHRGAFPTRMASIGAPRDPARYPVPDSTIRLTGLRKPSAFGMAVGGESSLEKSTQNGYAPELGARTKTAPVPTQPDFVNHPGPAPGRLRRFQSFRFPSKPPVQAVPNTETGRSVGHTRTASDSQPNFSRKINSDDYARTNDARFPNVVEVTASNAPPMKTKKKWWQPRSKAKREASWMDTVVRSGSRSGTILVDDRVGSPVARY
ncbi:hypothetical protein LTR37_017724 [Vermiconidia calcicola]|uniref:Uncharacterized protein n=1 Tax=Vermiconidia calcicola TaxID=1690605 RepID=A0ACC3MK17_9PEZI|nr:hypothetical protein LTR37_017724 [Vermiconidia calcicola]